MLFASEVLRTIATSSSAALMYRAMRVRTSAHIRVYFSRFWNETSASSSRVAASTASTTLLGAGHRFAAFIMMKPSRTMNCAFTLRQYASSVRPGACGSEGADHSAPSRAIPTFGITASPAVPVAARLRKSRRVAVIEVGSGEVLRSGYL